MMIIGRLVVLLSGILRSKHFAFFRFALVWFYGISTSVGYLMPNPFLYI